MYLNVERIAPLIIRPHKLGEDRGVYESRNISCSFLYRVSTYILASFMGGGNMTSGWG